MSGLLSFLGRLALGWRQFRGNALWQMENQEFSRVVLDDLEGRMSVHHEKHRDNYVVRRREEGTNRSRRFADEAEAEAFDAGVPGVHAI